MRFAKTIICLFSFLSLCIPARHISSQTRAQNKHIVIAASALLDGKGRILRDTRIVIDGSKIVA